MKPLFTAQELGFTCLSLSPGEKWDIEAYAREQRVEFVELANLTREDLEKFHSANVEKLPLLEAVKKTIAKPGVSPAARYNFEYSDLATLSSTLAIACPGEVARSETFYRIWSALIDPKLSTRVLGELGNFQPTNILDVGCGNGQLLDFILERQGVFANWQHSQQELGGIDLAKAAIDRFQRTKIKGFTGTVIEAFEKGLIEQNSIDCLFLSYFIDRDANQLGTFRVSKEILAPRGLLVFEGLLPAKLQDSNGVNYGGLITDQITGGETAAQDIALIVQALSNDQIKLTRIVVGSRLVFCADGFEQLPSVYLIFRKGD